MNTITTAIAFFLFPPITIFAKPPSPCANPNPPSWCFSGGGPCAGPNPPSWCGNVNVPIDQHILWLALAGLLFGLYVLRRKNISYD